MFAPVPIAMDAMFNANWGMSMLLVDIIIFIQQSEARLYPVISMKIIRCNTLVTLSRNQERPNKSFSKNCVQKYGPAKLPNCVTIIKQDKRGLYEILSNIAV